MPTFNPFRFNAATNTPAKLRCAGITLGLLSTILALPLLVDAGAALTAPTALSASAASSSQINLTWY
jgi:hypothetical protein